MIEKVDSFDYFKVLEILNPYKERLEDIHKAYLNDEFEVEGFDYSDLFNLLQYYLESTGYEKYKIYDLATELKEKLMTLDYKDYSFNDYIRIEETYGMDMPHDFDQRWTLEDVYKHLLGLVKSEGLVIIENSIINGELLGIFNCFMIRV